MDESQASSTDNSEWISAGGGASTEDAMANAAYGVLASSVMQRLPAPVVAALSKASNALSISNHAKNLQYGPWGEFIMPAGGYKRPEPTTLHSKVLTNFGAYGGNYLTTGGVLTTMSILFHPMLLFLGVLLFFGHRRSQSDEAIVVAGRTLSQQEKSIGMGIITVGTVLLSGALSTMLWILMFVGFIVTLHASFHEPPVATAQLEGDVKAGSENV